jgi:hypothetical protein
MLMLEAEVHSSTSQHVRSHRRKNLAGSASAFERNSGAFEHSTALLFCQGLAHHMQTRNERSQVRERSGIGLGAFDRTVEA